MKYKADDYVIVWNNEEALKDKTASWKDYFQRLLTNKPVKIRYVYSELKEASIPLGENLGNIDVPYACIIPANIKAKKNKGWSAFKISWTKNKENGNLNVELWCNASIQRKLKKVVLDETKDYGIYTEGTVSIIKRHLIPTYIRNNFREEDLIVFSEDLLKTRVLKFETQGFDAVDTLKNRLRRVTESLETIEGRSDEITIKVIEK